MYRALFLGLYSMMTPLKNSGDRTIPIDLLRSYTILSQFIKEILNWLCFIVFLMYVMTRIV